MRLRKGGRVSDFSELGESKDLFELLEQRIEALAERHRESLARTRDLEAGLRERIEKEMAALREFAMQTSDNDALAQRLTAFDHMTIPLAEAALSAGLKQ